VKRGHCPLSRVMVLLAASVALHVFACPSARAHNGEPPPRPPGPPARPNAPEAGVKVTVREAPPPPRWSWIHWWEANRDRYLVTPSQNSPALQVDDPRSINDLRAEAAAALMKVMDEPNKHDALVLESSMALGKMGHAPALPVLKQLIARAASVRGRPALLSAMGLLGSPEADSALIAYKPSRADDDAAATASIGLLRQIQPDTLRRLRAAINAQDPAVATAACFALRQHHQKSDSAYYTGLLRSSDSPWVACDALLAIGQLKDPQSLHVLESVLFGDANAAREVQAWAALGGSILQTDRERDRRDTTDNYERAYQQYRERFDKYQRLNPNAKNDPKGPDSRAKAIAGGEIVIGLERLPMGWLRSSAAIALGKLDQPSAGNVLLRFLAPTRGEVDPFAEAPKAFAVMSLVEYPSEETCDRLIMLLGKWDAGANKLALDVPRDSAVRGLAALALGLYARPYDTEQGAADRPGLDRAITTLAERLEDANEDAEVRTACALALGLSQRTVVLPILQRASDAVQQGGRKQDLLIFGYLMLGRALAGDANVIEPAGRFLQADDDTSPSGILGRRAAVLALGVTRSSLAIPILTRAWNLNHYVNREVIVAIRLIGGSGVARPLLKRLAESKDGEERAYMAQALGEILAVEHPTPLARLTAHANYTVRNDKMLPLQRLANGFLYDYLIASFGEEW
jgi:HEAT repeat protein